MIYNRIELVKTHDIKRLIELITLFVPAPINPHDAGVITQYAISTRYPGDYDTVTEDEWKQALKIAEKTLNWAKVQIISNNKA